MMHGSVTHSAQQKAWDEEHKKPVVLKQMDSDEASSGVQKFFDLLIRENAPHASGLEEAEGRSASAFPPFPGPGKTSR